MGMKVLAYGCTSRGMSRSEDSDSLTVKVADAQGEKSVLAILARSKGAKKDADLAGATAVRLFSDWYAERLPSIISGNIDAEEVADELLELLRRLHERVQRYGDLRRIPLKVDVTAAVWMREGICFLNTGAAKLFCFSVGTGTEDFEYYAASQTNLIRYIEPICSDAVYLICSNEIEETRQPEKLADFLAPEKLSDLLSIKMLLTHLTESNGHARGYGNASAILIRWMGEAYGNA